MPKSPSSLLKRVPPPEIRIMSFWHGKRLHFCGATAPPSSLLFMGHFPPPSLRKEFFPFPASDNLLFFSGGKQRFFALSVIFLGGNLSQSYFYSRFFVSEKS